MYIEEVLVCEFARYGQECINFVYLFTLFENLRQIISHKDLQPWIISLTVVLLKGFLHLRVNDFQLTCRSMS